MASDLMLSNIQVANFQTKLMEQILQLLANYVPSGLPAHDVVTGVIPSATVTALLATIAGNQTPDAYGKLTVLQNMRAADAAQLSAWLQQVGLYSLTAVLTSVPTTLSSTSGTLNSVNQIINASGTFTLTLPAPSSMPGQVITLKSIAAQIVNSASANVVPLGGGAAAVAIFPATANKFATLVSDNSNWVVMVAN